MLKNINKQFKPILKLPRYAKRSIAIIADVGICILSLWIALFLRLDTYQFNNIDAGLKYATIYAIIIAIPIFWLMGLYRAMFRYTNISILFTILFSFLIYGLIYFSVIALYRFEGIPRSIGILQPLIFFLIMCSSRITVMFFLVDVFKSQKEKKLIPKALIYGAGDAGRQLLYALRRSNEMNVVGLIDDDINLQNQIMENKTIYSSDNLGNLIASKGISYVLLAIPSINRRARLNIIKRINNYNVIVKTLPSVNEIIKDKVTISDIHDMDVEDILSREQAIPDLELLKKNVNSKVVLVTGAGGSIGSELCRQIIKLEPDKILLIDINEYSLYKIHSELEEINNLQKKINKIKIIPLLASVQDKIRITEIVKNWKPDTLYHAAAYKHVTLVEENVSEGIKNNVFGTIVCSEVAIENNVSNMVLVSTDKAVRPTNIMGATKRIAELCAQALYFNSKIKKTKLSIVRFGNVLGSSGSVIPKFRKQIRNGGPITLTHVDVTRYFMTIPEASQLVMQAGALTNDCDIFVLDMGDPVKIKDIIYRIVKLSGLTVQDEKNTKGDIKIEITGLKPGEKLHEELMLGDKLTKTIHNKIQKAQDPYLHWSELKYSLKNLEVLLKKNDIKEILKILEKLVLGYSSKSQILDKVFLEKMVNQSLKKN